MPSNRVLLVLGAIGVVAAVFLDFLTLAPNRLVTGAPVPFGVALHGLRPLALLPGAGLVGLAWRRRSSRSAGAAAVCASLFLASLVWLAGSEAALLAASRPPAARIGLGAGFWVMFGVTALALADALGRLAGSPLVRAAVAIASVLPTAAVIGAGAAGQLGIMREYAAERAVFAAAVLRHVELAFGALVLALAIGVPLGLLAARRTAWRAPLFSVLNVIQTIPAIAMFGLLVGPLGALSQAVPALGRAGIGGIGMVPAIIALTLYGLLPIARNTEAGLAAVAPPVKEAARGMGMTARQILLRVELPLALPVFLAGVRITLVQIIGLAVLAALVGAGGLGAIMFHGLFADALGQVLLGVIPVVLMALAAEAGMTVLIAFARR